jgi:hypothetical protein
MMAEGLQLRLPYKRQLVLWIPRILNIMIRTVPLTLHVMSYAMVPMVGASLVVLFSGLKTKNTFVLIVF